MKKIVLFTVTVVMFYCFNIYADSCETSELSRLRDISNHVEFSYDYDIKKEDYEQGVLVDVNNKITAVNLNPEIKVLIYEDYYKDKYKEFKYNDSKMATLSGFSEGEKVTVTIEAYVANKCSGKKLLTKTINIPYYNTFYNSEECEENREFEYCKKEIVNSIISSKDFYNKLELYKNGAKEIGNDSVDVTNNTSNNNSLLIVIGIVVSVIIITVVVVFIKKKRKKDLL